MDRWIREGQPAESIALADLFGLRVWMLTVDELASLARQKSSGRFHLYTYTDPRAQPRQTDRLVHACEFEPHLLENRCHDLFGA